MGRPLTNGLNYFPMGVDFYDDPKIIYVEEKHGVHGGYIASRLLAIIYREGYYIKWDEDSPLIISKRMGNGITSELVSEVVNTLLKKGFFSQEKLNEFGILTSAGIQRRWLHICSLLRRKGMINASFVIVNVNEKQVSSEETTYKRALSTQKKRKEKKGNKNPPISPKGDGVLFSADSPVTDNWESDFERFWNLYGKKTGRAKCEKKFSRLSKDDRAKVLQHVPQYVLAWPDPQYRKNPEGYLNGRLWEDEYLPGKEGANTPTTKPKIVV